MRTVWAASLALIGCLCLTAPTQASGPQEGGAQINIGAGPSDPAEARAQRTLDAATTAFQRGSYRALRSHLSRLKQALNAGPASYPLIEHVGAGRWHVRADDLSEAILRSAVASSLAEETEPGVRAEISTGPNVYPMIALVLGSEAVERRAYDEALGYLDRGLSMQPGHIALAAEKMSALHGLRRWSDALAVGDAALTGGGLETLMGDGSAIIHRHRGFSLIELGRLEEARAAYNRSLELEPGNEAALHELEYIASLEAGGPSQTPGVVSPSPTAE